MNQLSKLKVENIWLDENRLDIFDEDDNLIAGIEVDETNKGVIYLNIYFDNIPFRYYEDDIIDSDINDEIKMSLLTLFEDYREIQEHRNDDDPDHRADLIREWKEEN